MRAWFVFAGGLVAALVGIGALTRAAPHNPFIPALYGAVVMASGLGTLALRKHREKRDRTAADGSMERELADRSAAWSFQVALVVIAGFGLYLLLIDQVGSGLLAFGLLGVVVAVHWIHYAILRDRLT
ncbi:hypothetical protein SAMN05216410_0462 [Sanguibacter gelidistatuariae]|uniref:DUF2178 domain-containing protein n=1 Tax=Sanguibacter gelidistatuariae TaxID=1814289 RepID=A0A1G6GTB2_9MICO|nr:hypothetical protein [Sanguibacter gelidistatuariae]SDB85260.1 hypothetical protein SAMN05216410_0462 [Sanguibacter gelidistatuariae]